MPQCEIAGVVQMSVPAALLLERQIPESRHGHVLLANLYIPCNFTCPRLCFVGHTAVDSVQCRKLVLRGDTEPCVLYNKHERRTTRTHIKTPRWPLTPVASPRRSRNHNTCLAEP